MSGVPTIQFYMSTGARQRLLDAGVAELGGRPVEQSGALSLRLPEGSENVDDVLRTLFRLGFQKRENAPSGTSSDSHFYARRIRVYGDEERAAAEVLCWWGANSDYYMIAEEDRERGSLVIDAGDVPDRWSFDRVFSQQRIWDAFPYLLVNARVRAEMESARFSGVTFRDVLLRRPTDEDGDSDTHDDESAGAIVPCAAGQEIYEVCTKVELPPMFEPANAHRTELGRKLPVTNSSGVLVNPGFDDLQPLYRRSDIERVRPFDIAWTRERIGYPTVDAKLLIVSQRVARLCLGHIPRADFWPVEIVDE